MPAAFADSFSLNPYCERGSLTVPADTAARGPYRRIRYGVASSAMKTSARTGRA